MYDGRTQVTTHSTTEHSERRTTGGAVAYLLLAPALVAALAAPAVALGMVLGVAALHVGERVLQRLRQRGGLSPPSTESTSTA